MLLVSITVPSHSPTNVSTNSKYNAALIATGINLVINVVAPIFDTTSLNTSSFKFNTSNDSSVKSPNSKAALTASNSNGISLDHSTFFKPSNV